MLHVLKKDDDDLSPPRQLINPTLFESLGVYGVCVIIVGFVVLLGAIGFLTFIWFGDNEVWRRIALAGWVPRSISLTSAAIRVVIAFQAGIATSMIASMILQAFQVLLSEAPSVSMMRWQTSGPHHLFRSMIAAIRRTGVTVFVFATMMLTVTTIASQFISTILLSDVKDALTFTTTNQSRMMVELDNEIPSIYTVMSSQSSYLLERPGVFPTFAEYHSEEYADDSIYDTGQMWRAFLPFDNVTHRSSLRDYTGWATALDARVVCARPKIQYKVDFEGWLEWSDFYRTFISLSGSVGLDIPLSNLYFSDVSRKMTFNCTAAFSKSAYPQDPTEFSVTSTKEWQLTLCPLDTDIYDAWRGIIPDKITDAILAPYSPYLVFNTSGSFEAWYEVAHHKIWNESRTNPEQDPEWALYSSQARVGTETEEVHLGVSICFTRGDGVDLFIRASGGVAHEEAKLAWDEPSSSYDTLPIRKSLAATVPYISPQDRGHLFMGPLTEKVKNFEDYNGNIFEKPFEYELTSNRSLFMCTYCETGDVTVHETDNIGPDGKLLITEVHPALSTIFNDVVRHTKHPALAIQAIFTIVAGMSYVDTIELFTEYAPATYSNYVPILKPTSQTGYAIVLVVVLTHCIFVIAVTWMFARSAKQSFIGNAWSAMAQVAQSQEGQDWLRDASMSTDGMMTKRITMAKQNDLLVGVASSGTQSDGVYLRSRV